MSIKPISDDKLDCWRVLLLQKSEARQTRMVYTDTMRALIARIDAAENRVCRWWKTKDTDDWATGCTGNVQDEYYAIDHPDHCPECGGRIVVGADEEGE